MASVIRHAAAGLRWILIGVVVAAVVAGAGVSVATVTLGHTPHTGNVSLDQPVTEWSLVADPGIDRQQAMDAAVAAVPDSRAVSAEFETEHRIPVWEVEVVTSAGVEYEVTVDAKTGEVIGTVDHD
ncbi:PepSY domain-containing protein [Nocardia sp. NBC_01329]|uniref:PepSY domain-containing protein n=1 Tax=Nocardia sp. NBC_01329 TaxID=2903594 RepID=UPI002E0F8DBE|nr:PepSY domain-containing protein [Nocardia sp. NBC_01329]